MATYAAVIASGSTNGRQVKIAATATPGTLLHTAHATALDEVYVWITNNDTVAREVTIELGGTTSVDDLVKVTIASKSGYSLVVPGVRFTGGVAIRAFGAAANVLCAAVNINRIT